MYTQETLTLFAAIYNHTFPSSFHRLLLCDTSSTLHWLETAKSIPFF